MESLNLFNASFYSSVAHTATATETPLEITLSIIMFKEKWYETTAETWKERNEVVKFTHYFTELNQRRSNVFFLGGTDYVQFGPNFLTPFFY